jgi:hypothetical protein
MNPYTYELEEFGGWLLLKGQRVLFVPEANEAVMQAKAAEYNAAAGPEEPASLDACLAAGERHIGNYFSTAQLLQLKSWLDLFGGNAGTKLQQTYEWTTGITAMAASRSTDFPPAPFAFAELVEEAMQNQ